MFLYLLLLTARYYKCPSIAVTRTKQPAHSFRELLTDQERVPNAYRSRCHRVRQFDFFNVTLGRAVSARDRQPSRYS